MEKYLKEKYVSRLPTTLFILFYKIGEVGIREMQEGGWRQLPYTHIRHSAQ